MRPLGDALAAAGFAVRAVRLPGHGTTVEDLARVCWRDWIDAATGGLDALGAECARVAVAGLSMGALVALHLAASRPADVCALVLCAPALALRDPRVRLLPLIARVPALARRFALLPKHGGRDIADPAARTASFTYAATPLAAVVELLRLQRVVRGEIPRVEQPTLLLHGRGDHTVPVAVQGRLQRDLGARWIEAHVLERSWHVVTLDHDRDEVGRLAVDFLGRVEEAGTTGALPRRA